MAQISGLKTGEEMGEFEIPATIAEQVNFIRDIQVTKERTEVILKRFGDAIDTCSRQLKASLLAGGTTGDPVQDLVIMAGHGIDPYFVDACRELQEMLKGRKGQLALLMYDRTVKVPFGSPGSSLHRVTMCGFCLLEAEDLVLIKDRLGQRLSIQTSHYVWLEKRPHPKECKLYLSGAREEGNILSTTQHRQNTPPHLHEILFPRGMAKGAKWDSHVRVGDVPIEAWLEINNMAGLYEPLFTTLHA